MERVGGKDPLRYILFINQSLPQIEGGRFIETETTREVCSCPL